MGLPRRYLGADEVEVLHVRTHGKALFWPAVILLLTAVAAGIGLALVPPTWQPWSRWVIVAAALLLVVVWVVVPFLRWLTTTYTITDRRIITRRGIVNKSGHDIPLTRINNVAYERSLLDRMLGCGTLVLTTAAEEPVSLHDIPDVEHVHVVMTELLFQGDSRPSAIEDKDE